MDRENKAHLDNLDKLIREGSNLKALTQHEAWGLLLRKMAEMRVDALDDAVAEGDTTDKKAYARAIGCILNFFYSLENEIYLDDLVAQRERLLDEIGRIEKDRAENINLGLGSTI